ncbi:hypothetical protein CPC08DRAFT_139849 [Agrocybe pediades]|nr:hypothetical protein CPC08DRAFT_139849 [Agrocybe pediades]
MSSPGSSSSPSTTPVNRPIPLPQDSTSSTGSTSGGTPRLSSPLNPLTPKKSPIALPTVDQSHADPLAGINHRVHSLSDPTRDVHRLHPSQGISITALAAAAQGNGGLASISAPELDIYSDEIKSTFRERSRSPSRSMHAGGDQSKLGIVTDAAALSSSWWAEKRTGRSWHDVPKRKKTLPADHAVALEDTRKRVAQAVVSALGTAADVAHEALFLGVELLELAPIPGLRAAASTLLDIWDAAQNVDMNRLGCLRLTERCADILIAVREEIHEAGDEVGEELADPIAKLEHAFMHIYRFMLKQNNRPWLKRYLKRDEILRDIAGCDSMLRDALSIFGVSIQIRTLKQVQRNERIREQQTQELISALRASASAGRILIPDAGLKMIDGLDVDITSTDRDPYSLATGYSYDTVTQFAATSNNALGLSHLESEAEPLTPTKENSGSSVHTSNHDVLPALATIQNVQNSLDAARDSTDLRNLMRAALQTSSDAEMIEVLQIGRQEMPDAIKTLQRALEKLSERDAAAAVANADGGSYGSSTDGSGTLPSKGVVLGKITRRVSLKEPSSSQAVSAGDPGQPLVRRSTIISMESNSSSEVSASGASSSDVRKRDTLDREFIETGIDALRRMSRGQETTVPSWTITKYEVDRDEKIGIGFFSDVYKGVWRGRTVAIKVLAETTPRKLFVREIGIWKTLNHPNVLPLYGASSATGDPPWFFVSPYLKNGTLVEHLKRVEHEQRPPGLGVGHSSGHVMTTSMLQTPRSQGWRANTLPPVAWSVSSPPGGGGALPPQGSVTPPLGTSRKKSPTRDGDASNNNNNTATAGEVDRSWDLIRFMHEIAKGMEYLHAKGVLHGDLKASNVLVDDKYRCVISDFGQSEMKSEAFRISGTPPPHGTLRWQAPEFMSGKSQLTQAVDVWAFSITCVEILTMGRMPWPLMDDTAVRHFVLNDNSRPPIPKHSRFNTPKLQDVLRGCWHANPDERVTFSKIARDLKLIRKTSGLAGFESPRLPAIEDAPEPVSSPSPDLRPRELPQYIQEGQGSLPPDDVLVTGSVTEGSQLSHQDGSTSEQSRDPVHRENTVARGIKMPEPVIFTPGPSSRTSSIVASIHSEEHINIVDYDAGYESPPPIDTRIAEMKNERRYRMLLVHDFHPSLTLALWDPSPVEIGAVGYLSRPQGRFITLFNALNPRKGSHPGIQLLPSIYGYGQVKDDVQRLPKKTVAQRAMDMFIGSLNFRNSSEDIVRRPAFPLRAGHKAAYLYTEVTEYRYMLSLDAPKKWFQANVDAILRVYAYSHQIQKEDLFLIIGTLQTPAYALLVSHHHPEGHARFNVYANPQVGQPWGMFTTDTEIHELGPTYDERDETPRPVISKISNHGDPWAAVLLARLRFKPDVLEPTSK